MTRPPKRIDYWYNLKTYFHFLSRYKLAMVGLLFVILVVESTSVLDKLLFKIIIDRGALYLESQLSRESFVMLLLMIGGVYLLLILGRSVGKWCNLSIINSLEAKLIADLKRHYFNHLLRLAHNFHVTHKTGSLIARLTRGGGSIERMTDVIAFNGAPMLFQMVAVGSTMLYFDRMSAFVSLLTVGTFISFSFAIQYLQQKSNVMAIEAEDREKGYISDVFTNIDSIKYFGKEDVIGHRYRKISEWVRVTMLRRWNYYRWMDGGQGLILGLGTFFILYFPLQKFLNGWMSAGTLVFIYTAYGNLVAPLHGFVHGMREFYRAMADFESLFQYGKIENEIKEPRSAPTFAIREGTIEFKKVTFKYHAKRLFNDFNLKIHTHEKVALVGHSGSGKTTLVKLLYRFYDVESGSILIDGKNITKYKQESIRSELSIVPQECVLFDDTIFNNILFSRPDARADEVMRAMKFAQLDKTVAHFPKKENTVVGERGVRLSGGEKQRVSIARALLANKKILVLDEATSSLDSLTEHEIQKSLADLMKGRTTIIIAHRLSTIMKADRIVVMEKGRIVQIGSHKELIRRKGPYRRLWNLQKGGYIQ